MRTLATVIMCAAVLAAVGNAATDPRVCAGHTAVWCGDSAAEIALIKHMNGSEPGWTATIRCRAYVGYLRYRCTWKNSLRHGADLIVFKPGTFAVTVTPRP